MDKTFAGIVDDLTEVKKYFVTYYLLKGDCTKILVYKYKSTGWD